MTEGGTAIALSWLCTAWRLGRQSRRSTGRGAVNSLNWPAATPAMLRRLLFFFGASVSTHAGFVEVLGWFLMAPKILRTPRVVWGKPNLEINAGRRDKKHSAAPQRSSQCTLKRSTAECPDDGETTG
ncbi:hypothetical protein NDU88_002827 [Pleurodeles waltl]|uniref:Uncharacterized protein n=1 Tax=Pleurodeles waltl TaxID=8319 RepID=A0AAV7UAQ9_PLEWA|nr:hypothetical protein NDU88_002827 [Pleurodeles waltl]